MAGGSADETSRSAEGDPIPANWMQLESSGGVVMQGLVENEVDVATKERKRLCSCASATAAPRQCNRSAKRPSDQQFAAKKWSQRLLKEMLMLQCPPDFEAVLALTLAETTRRPLGARWLWVGPQQHTTKQLVAAAAAEEAC